MVNLMVQEYGYGKQIFKFSNIIHLDVNIVDNVHVVGDGQNLPFKNNLFLTLLYIKLF